MSVLNAVTDFGAIGDGVTSTGAQLQNAINAISPTSPVLLIPAGQYRIDTPLDIPNRQGFEILGEGRLGATTVLSPPSSYGENRGTLLIQSDLNAPIIRFTKRNTHSWALRRLGFRWYQTMGEISAGTSGANAHAIQFARHVNGQGESVPGVEDTDYYFGLIEDCSVAGGYRGISMGAATAATNNKIGLWSTTIRNCNFFSQRGAAIHLASPQAFGMPNNQISAVYIDSKLFSTTNRPLEPMIVLVGQNNGSLSALDLEDAYRAVISASGSTMTLNGIYLERCFMPQGEAFLFLMDAPYDVRGLTIEGRIEVGGIRPIINGYGAPAITLSGVTLNLDGMNAENPYHIFHRAGYPAGFAHFVLLNWPRRLELAGNLDPFADGHLVLSDSPGNVLYVAPPPGP